MLKKIKSNLNIVIDFICNNCTAIITSTVIFIIVLINFILFFPVKETMTIKEVWWDWQIPINKFSVVTHTSDCYPYSDDAYDIREEHIRHTKTVTDQDAYTDSNGTYHPKRTHTEVYYTTKYHYKRNEWKFSYYIPSFGTDREPHEAECSIPYPKSNPELGDLSRGSVVQKYGITGIKKDGSGDSYNVSELDWKRVEKGGHITYKYRRINKSKIYDLEFN